MMSYQQRLGDRLRSIRAQQGLTLQEVEDRSAGEWKAVVIGSYERGDRAGSVEKLDRLAEFYGVPLSDLLPANGPNTSPADEEPRLIVDLARLAELRDEASFATVHRYVKRVMVDRGDYNVAC